MKFTLLIIFSFLMVFPAYGHMGRVDVYGCHHNRKAETYECHKGEFKGQRFSRKAEMIVALGGEPLPPEEAEYKAKVIAVIDGDTIDVLYRGKVIRIRLAEIDAPEMGQPYGPEAKEYVADQVLGRMVEVEKVEIGVYGRQVAFVSLLGDVSLNQKVIQAGLAWRDRKHSKRPDFRGFERIARRGGAGLWGQKEVSAPWNFRKRAKRKFNPFIGSLK